MVFNSGSSCRNKTESLTAAAMKYPSLTASGQLLRLQYSNNKSSIYIFPFLHANAALVKDLFYKSPNLSAGLSLPQQLHTIGHTGCGQLLRRQYSNNKSSI